MSEKLRFNNFGLGLLVIRSNDIDRAAEFYAALGLTLVRHTHPPCGDHFSAVSDAGVVFEICKRNEKHPPTTAVVFGFNVSSVEEALATVTSNGGTVKRGIESSDWGTSAVVTDLDGHTVLLIENR